MGFWQSFLLALKSLFTSKLRSFLTMLGIIIGVASVIVIISLGDGMTQDMSETFESMGTNLITANITGRGAARSVSADDLYAFAEENADLIAAVTPTVDVSATVKSGSTQLSSTGVTGVGEDFCQIKNYALTEGRFIEYIDILRRQQVCVIGSYVAQELFAGQDPLGQQLRINGNAYTVVGVLAEKAGSEEGSTDDHLFIPYTNAAKMSFLSTISNYAFSARDENTVELAKAAIEGMLYQKIGDDDAYSVISQAEMLSSLSDLTGTVMLVLVAIAAVSLLVGGIGIMNIMLVSVTERTREIGIRKSLGARRRDILRQFVIEAGTTSSVGGVLGILMGVAVATAAGGLLGISSKPTVNSIALAFLVSLGIGVIFGYLPARRAARLNPIDALRYE